MKAATTAYKGVVRPVEGTILTVAKDMARAAEESRKDSNEIITIMEKNPGCGGRIAEEHPQPAADPEASRAWWIPAAKVWSSSWKACTATRLTNPWIIGEVAAERTAINLDAMQLKQMHEEIEPGQDFEIVVDFRPDGELNLESFYDDLGKIGTSIQVGEGDDMYRMHIHVATEKKYEPIELVGKYGRGAKGLH